MVKPKKWSILLMSSVAVLMLGLLGGIALAQGETLEAEAPAQQEVTPETDGSPSLRGPSHWGGLGRHGSDNAWLERLAEALGITVERLEEAQDQAYAATVADAVATGQITQEQADQLLAKRALTSYIDRTSILATALGTTVEDLETAVAEGRSLSDLIDESGTDLDTLRANAQAAYEAAVQQAAADGVVTQEQADEFLSNYSFSLSGRGGHGGHRGSRGDGRWHGTPSTPDSDTTDPGTTDTTDTTNTSFDA